ncbi:MAG: RNA polymerase sigma factor [Crocinitomicaceae bacterium]
MESKEELNYIIDGCIRNKRKHQEKLFKLYYGKMMGVALRYTKDNDTAQEIVQNSFIKIYDKLNTFEKEGSFFNWITRIVINTSIDAIRKSKKEPFKFGDEYIFVEESSEDRDEELDVSNYNSNVILEAIQELSPAYQTVFNLYVVEDYKHKEISEILGISEGTSKSNLSKAKNNLQKILLNKKEFNTTFNQRKE